MKVKKTLAFLIILILTISTQVFAVTRVEIDNDNGLASRSSGWINYNIGSNWSYISSGNYSDSRRSPSNYTARSQWYNWMKRNSSNGLVGTGWYGIDIYLNNSSFNDRNASYLYQKPDGHFELIKNVNQETAPAGWSYVKMFYDNPVYNAIYLVPSGDIYSYTGADTLRYSYAY